MLAHAKLSKKFWARALMTTTYVINRLPSTALDRDIPQRVWTGKDVSYRHQKSKLGNKRPLLGRKVSKVVGKLNVAESDPYNQPRI